MKTSVSGPPPCPGGLAIGLFTKVWPTKQEQLRHAIDGLAHVAAVAVAVVGVAASGGGICQDVAAQEETLTPLRRPERAQHTWARWWSLAPTPAAAAVPDGHCCSPAGGLPAVRGDRPASHTKHDCFGNGRVLEHAGDRCKAQPAGGRTGGGQGLSERLAQIGQGGDRHVCRLGAADSACHAGPGSFGGCHRSVSNAARHGNWQRYRGLAGRTFSGRRH